jgi:hypothetical protein
MTATVRERGKTPLRLEVAGAAPVDLVATNPATTSPAYMLTAAGLRALE